MPVPFASAESAVGVAGFNSARGRLPSEHVGMRRSERQWDAKESSHHGLVERA